MKDLKPLQLKLFQIYHYKTPKPNIKIHMQNIKPKIWAILIASSFEILNPNEALSNSKYM